MIQQLLTACGKEIIVLPQHIERLAKFKWYFSGRRITRQEYFGSLQIKYPIANEVLQIDSKILVDHKDRNPFNNLDDNLRIATQQQNGANKLKKPGCASIYKGVTWNKAREKWRACITFNRKCIHLGYFTNEIEAAKAYNEATAKYFGEFAVLNTF